MDIFGIPDPDPHENLCGAETLILAVIDVRELPIPQAHFTVFRNPM